MPPLPILKVRVLLKYLTAHGFVVLNERGKGAHRFLRDTDGRTTTVSGNAGADVARPLLRKVLADTDLTIDELVGGKRNPR